MGGHMWHHCRCGGYGGNGFGRIVVGLARVRDRDRARVRARISVKIFV